MSEDTHVSFLEDELRYAGERCEALAAQKAVLVAAIRQAIRELELAPEPEYAPIQQAWLARRILEKALL